MDMILYLYKNTLSNYMKEEIYNEPIFELYLIDFVSTNMNIVNVKEYTYYFITSLHCELDKIFYNNLKPDSKHGYKILESSSTYFKLKKIPEIKKLAEKISEQYLKIVK